MTEALNKKAGDMDTKQRDAWEIVQKLQALSILIDHYTDLEDNYKNRVSNEALQQLFEDGDLIMKIRETDFVALLNMIREATQFIFKKEVILREYQKNLDSKNLLETDPIFQKLYSLNNRIKTLEQDKQTLAHRNKVIEKELDATENLKREIEELNYKLKEKDLEISVDSVDRGPQDGARAVQGQSLRPQRHNREPQPRPAQARSHHLAAQKKPRTLQRAQTADLRPHQALPAQQDPPCPRKP
jgi:hypothetical protein